MRISDFYDEGRTAESDNRPSWTVPLPIWKRICPWEMYAREYRRIFGMAEFDYIVDFQGYNVILTSVLSTGKAKEKVNLAAQ